MFFFLGLNLFTKVMAHTSRPLETALGLSDVSLLNVLSIL